MLTESGIKFKAFKPMPPLESFVESIWMLENTTDIDSDLVVLPDGRFDIIFLLMDDTLNATLKGLDTEPQQTALPPNSKLFAVSFKLLAIEYLLDMEVQTLLNEGKRLPNGYWGVNQSDFDSFEAFCKKITARLEVLIKPNIDSRKQDLFDLIYSTNGTLTIKELSEKVFWSSRQINRYFTKTFGLSLKSYCNIIRFKSSLPHIKKGKLFPELNFADQNHFIREIKKMTGVTPKELSKNQNDRFILLSAIE